MKVSYIFLVVMPFATLIDGFKVVQKQHYFDAKAGQDYLYFKTSIGGNHIEMIQVAGSWSSVYKDTASIKTFNKDSLIINVNKQTFMIANSHQTAYLDTKGVGSFKFKHKEYLFIKQELVSHSKVHGITYTVFEKSGTKIKLICVREMDNLPTRELWKLL